MLNNIINYGTLSVDISNKEAYLDYIVVKPIPNSVIGFTVSKTYDTTISGSLDRRDFWGTREYSANLFGVPLSINSLAFQELDSVVSACTTTAI